MRMAFEQETSRNEDFGWKKKSFKINDLRNTMWLMLNDVGGT